MQWFSDFEHGTLFPESLIGLALPLENATVVNREDCVLLTKQYFSEVVILRSWSLSVGMACRVDIKTLWSSCLQTRIIFKQ